MLLFDAPLTLREFMTHEEVPLADVFREVLRFLTDRGDAVLFGAHAVNAYCDVERMTQDIDVLSTDAARLAEAIRDHLATRFHLAVRIREVVPGLGFRIYQLRKPKNRHLVDLRQVSVVPPSVAMERILVLAPVELIAMKIVSCAARRGRPKADTDRVDLHRLLLTFPDLKAHGAAVENRLRTAGAPNEALEVWSELVDEHIEPDDDDAY